MAVTSKDEIIRRLTANSDTIKQMGVKRLGLFGSFVRGQQQDTSDVDILVEYQPGTKTYRNFLATADYLEKLLDAKVDLVTQESVSPYIAPHIQQEINYVQISD